jgi:hypothetical protein
MSQSEEKPFTVTDRRLFAPDGSRRADAEPADAAAPAAVPAAHPAEPSPRPSLGESVDFSQFLLSLAAQAGLALQPGGGGEGVAPHEALAHARSFIGILEMLEDKTRGRRTAEEDRLLDDLLYELRMVYLERKGAVAP